jgi:hypothetical protein
VKSAPQSAKPTVTLFFVPCSCGRNLIVCNGDAPSGPRGRHLQCPHCGKKHDRHYRAIRLQYEDSR